MTKKIWIPALIAVTAIGLVACNQKKAGDHPAPKPAVATVNGKTISGEAFDIWVKAQTNKKTEDVTPEQRKRGIPARYSAIAVGVV